MEPPANDSTLDGTGAGAPRPRARPTMRKALVLVWSAAEPDRLGEAIALADDALERGALFGRGGPQPGDALPRVFLSRARPGELAMAASLDNPVLSRAQLVLRAHRDGVLVENVGKRAALVDGREIAEPTVVPVGGTVELKSQLLFLCVERPTPLPRLAHLVGPLPAFGDADADGLVGESAAAWALRDQAAFAAKSGAHVLVHGESGSGKELVAQAIHRLSPRAGKPMVTRNAATLPAGIVDAELFGNVANYPNAGMPERVGVIGEAHGSTLFLDEIGELPTELQSRLLRVLDAGEYHRLGDARARRASLRVVAATNRPLSELKHDLVARFGVTLEVPGLGARREDVPLLARQLLKKRSGQPLSAELARALVGHTYTTHARELDALLWRAQASASGERLELTDDVRAAIVVPPPSRAPTREYTADEIRAALARNGGVRERVWRELGMANRYVLKRAMQKYGLADADED